MPTIYSIIRQDLHNRYAHTVSADVIDSVLNETWVSHASTAVLEDYLPVLVEREVEDILENMGAQPRVHITFVSRNNPALADAAVAITRHLNQTVVATSENYHPENLANSSLEEALRAQDITPVSGTLGRVADRTLEAADYAIYLNDNEGNDVGAAYEENWDFTAENADEFVTQLRERIEDKLCALPPVLVSAEMAY